jgi:hypothetical protein
MDGAVSRPSRGALLLVSLSRAESDEWGDEAFRTKALETFRRMARAKGRRYLEVRDNVGRELAVAEVTP